MELSLVLMVGLLGAESTDLSNWKFLLRHVRADYLMLDYQLIFLVCVSLRRSPVKFR